MSRYGPMTFVALCKMKFPGQLNTRSLPLLCKLTAGTSTGTTSPVERIRAGYRPAGRPAGFAKKTSLNCAAVRAELLLPKMTRWLPPPFTDPFQFEIFKVAPLNHAWLLLSAKCRMQLLLVGSDSAELVRLNAPDTCSGPNCWPGVSSSQTP